MVDKFFILPPSYNNPPKDLSHNYTKQAPSPWERVGGEAF